uniref:Bestrophin homolog n=1 Tax=Panagrellus redivivus TaxID=6233 RepID=A0A7E4V5L6_PANRE
MTVTYTLSVSEARFWGFPRLLTRWRGSIYRLMYREMLAFLGVYYLLAVMYRWGFNEQFQRRFEMIAQYCHGFTSVVPITFVLGFYVTFIVGRWWQQYMAVPWPDRLAVQISAYVQGSDERGRMMRRALIRYANLISILTFQSTSTVIKARFPTLDHLVEAGLMTAEEKASLDGIETPHGIWWAPAQWFGQLAMLARKEGRIHDDLHLKSIMDDMLAFRAQCGTIWSYDWISVPLVYTQVVTIAVYSFFVACLFGRQYLYRVPGNATSSTNDEPSVYVHDVDYYVPIFTIFQFFFYVGWLKVAEAMICPFGGDDDDFEVNWVIDRNMQVGYLIVDRMQGHFPKLTRDSFWGIVEPEIPYTQAAAGYRGVPYFGSTQAMNIPERRAEWDFPEHMEPIDEEGKINGKPPSRVSNGRYRRAFRRSNKRGSSDYHDGDNSSIVSQSGSENSEDDDVDEDGRSCGSRQADEKRKKKRLGGLIQGFSRSTLASRFESKLSINSRASLKKCRSPPPPFAPHRQFSTPGSRYRISSKVSRANSPTSIEHMDELSTPGEEIKPYDNPYSNPAIFPPVPVIQAEPATDSSVASLNEYLAAANNFPPRTHDPLATSTQIDVPPVVQEEPEPDADTSCSGSEYNTLPKPLKTEKRPPLAEVHQLKKDDSVHGSMAPLIPPESEQNCD